MDSSLLQEIPNDGVCFGKQAKATTAASADWTTSKSKDFSILDVVTSVKEQGSCKAGWAFAVAGSTEGVMYMMRGTNEDLSPQQLIDCSKDYKNTGCSGGNLENSWAYYKKHGVASEKRYKYTGKDGSCSYDASGKVWEILECTNVTPKSEKDLRNAVAQQPTAGFMDGSSDKFKSYKSGVFKAAGGGIFPSKKACEDNKNNQGLLIVGYGKDGSDSFWKIKHSLGTSWGEKGFMRLARKEGDTSLGECGIQTTSSFPIA